MLRVAVFLVCLFCQSSTEPIEVKYRCNDSSIGPDVSYTTFTPSVDGVQGRYTAQLCTFNKPDRTHLTMDLTYKADLAVCDPEYRKNNSRKAYIFLKPGQQHSNNMINISGLANCSHICYAMDFDMIFSSCYLLKSTLKSGPTSHSPHDSYFLINNNTTKEMVNKTAPHITFTNHEDNFSLDWYLGIPAVDYSVSLRRMNNNTGDYLEDGIDVTQNCTLQPDVRQLFCELAPPYGCYQASFVHGGPWISGLFHQKTYVTYDHLCHQPVVPPTVPEPRSAALWWVCGAALLACSALVAAGLLRRRLLLRDYHKRLLDFWFNSRSSEADVETPPAETRDSHAVLLLYAREDEHGQQAIAALKELIQHCTGGTVYDLFSPSVMAQCGAAPHTWLRSLLQRDDVRVLLLQSPAAAVLYRDRLGQDDAGLRLREPLLGRRALYRAPHFGDQLLQMALRLLAESAHMHHHYHKFYLATYQELETDIVPQLVSYRRYVLPSAAPALCADLCGAAPEPARLAALSAAALGFVAHVQRHPHYLMDEIFIN